MDLPIFSTISVATFVAIALADSLPAEPQGKPKILHNTWQKKDTKLITQIHMKKQRNLLKVTSEVNIRLVQK